MFVNFDELSRKMQDNNGNILSSVVKIEGCRGKLKLWLEIIASGSTEMSPTVCSFCAEKTLLSVIEEHLNAIRKKKAVSKFWTGFVTGLVLSEHHFSESPRRIH
jgi:hypothetical protein